MLQFGDVKGPAVITNFDRIVKGKIAQRRRKVGSAGHRRVLQENRDDQNISSQRGSDLAPDVVTVRIEAAPGGIGRTEPFGSNQCQEDVAGSHGVLYGAIEPVTWLDGFDVSEDRPGTEVRSQPGIDAFRVVGGVLPTIADEDSSHADMEAQWPSTGLQ